jgi:HupE / UreJ protein
MKRIIMALSLLLLCSVALPHGTSRSYLTLEEPDLGGHRRGQWDLAVVDLAVAMPLDLNNDRRVVWGEVLAQEAAIQALARANLRFSDSAGACTSDVAPLMIDWHGEQSYVVAPLNIACHGNVGTLSVDYRFLAAIDSSHRMLVRLNEHHETRVLVVTPGAPRKIGAAYASPSTEFLRYLKEGAHHIWIGYDHLAFLFALLLPSVLRKSTTHWQPVPRPQDAIVETLKIVSAFTVSHSITLALASLGVFRPPAQAIEVAIALSVASAAALNLIPRWNLSGAWLAFGFGFVHGFGFANALADLGLSRGDVVVPLLGFNLGVEIGQLVVVAIVLPLLFIWRARRAYVKRWLPAASSMIVLLSLYWAAVRWPT